MRNTALLMIGLNFIACAPRTASEPTVPLKVFQAFQTQHKKEILKLTANDILLYQLLSSAVENKKEYAVWIKSISDDLKDVSVMHGALLHQNKRDLFVLISALRRMGIRVDLDKENDRLVEDDLKRSSFKKK
jgi:hypothetical protein